MSCALGVAISLSACSTLSMSDFGLGGSDSKKTTTTTQQTTATQRTNTSTAQKAEPGVWDRVTGWFSSDDKPAVKTDKLAQAQTAQSQAAQTTQAANASLRAAQDISKIQTPQTTAPQSISGQIAAPKVTAPVVTAPKVPDAPLKIASTQVNAPVTQPQQITQAPQQLANTSTNIQNKTAAQINTAQQQAQTAAVPATPQKEEGFWGRLGNFFSSDKNKQTTQQAAIKKPQSSVNSFARQAVNTNTSETDDDAAELTPVQTLRLARQSTKGAPASGQGLTPFVPNTAAKPTQAAPTTVADANLRTNSVNTKSASKPSVVTTAPKISTPKVAVKPISPQKSTQSTSQVPTASSSSTKTAYVVTPESYRARQTAPAVNSTRGAGTATKAATGNLIKAAPNQNAFKFFFNPGSADLAPHHIAQLRGLAGQAIARQRQITILGTSNPGGEAGKGASPAGLQNIATARAMAAARNLQKFGVPSHMINMRIAQSTTPTEIGTGGNKTLQTMTARRVEVSIQ